MWTDSAVVACASLEAELRRGDDRNSAWREQGPFGRTGSKAEIEGF